MDRHFLVAVNGISLFVRELGPEPSIGRPLVVLHGGPDWDHSYLMPGIRVVAEQRRVIMFDLRGCGRSSRGLPPEEYQPESIVDDVVALIDSLRFDTVDLLGFSTGGQLVQLYLAAHPGRIHAAILASTTAYGAVEQYLNGWDEADRRRNVVPPWPTWAGFFAGKAASDLERTIEWAVRAAPMNIWDIARLDEYLSLLGGIRFSGDWMGALQGGSLHPWRPPDPEQALQAFSGPILILHGAEDMVFPVQVAQRLASAVPHTRLAVIDDAGHMAHFERPDAWASGVVRFLSEADEIFAGE